MSSKAESMFAAATAPAIKTLAELRRELSAGLQASLVEAGLRDLRAGYAVTWEDQGESLRRERAALREPVHVAVCEARQALLKLLQSQGKQEVTSPLVERGDQKEGNNKVHGGCEDVDDDVVEVVVATKKVIETVEILDEGSDDQAEAIPTKNPSPSPVPLVVVKEEL